MESKTSSFQIKDSGKKKCSIFLRHDAGNGSWVLSPLPCSMTSYLIKWDCKKVCRVNIEPLSRIAWTPSGYKDQLWQGSRIPIKSSPTYITASVQQIFPKTATKAVDSGLYQCDNHNVGMERSSIFHIGVADQPTSRRIRRSKWQQRDPVLDLLERGCGREGVILELPENAIRWIVYGMIKDQFNITILLAPVYLGKIFCSQCSFRDSRCFQQP